MARPTVWTTNCTDLELTQGIKNGYRTVKIFTQVAGINYHMTHRVVNGKPCSPDEEKIVRTAWARYSPEAVGEKMQRVFAPLAEGATPHAVDVEDLKVTMMRLVAVCMARE